MKGITAVLAGVALAVMTAAGGTSRAHAQEQWGAPYCGDQPRISSIFDHEFPTFGANRIVRLYTGTDKANCRDPKGITFNASDGHEGWDYTRAARWQGCGTGERPGLAMDLVYAVRAGTVHRSRWDEAQHDGRAAHYGLYLDIAHGGEGPTRSLYGHLAAVFVEEGQSVQKGQLIGALGTTGNSTGPHLHFHAARGNDATATGMTFDVYGWCKDWASWNCPYPGFPDPHRGDGWSKRVMRPGLTGPSCPGGCGTWEVDDASPDVSFRCRSSASCPHWYTSHSGLRGGHHFTYQNGRSKDYYATYLCRACPPGTYLVEAYVPSGATAHIARYEIAGRVTVMDQHAESTWHPLGVFHFSGTPTVEVNDRTDRYDWGFEPSAHHRIGADTLRFTRICWNVPPGVG